MRGPTMLFAFIWIATAMGILVLAGLMTTEAMKRVTIRSKWVRGIVATITFLIGCVLAAFVSFAALSQ